jgi:chemotaxis protein CheD
MSIRIDDRLRVYYLQAGEGLVIKEPALIVTVLGSCLSVTVFCERMGIGAICHALMPRCPRTEECIPGCGAAARYVDCSVRQMLSRFGQLGARPPELQVKVFGGAAMFGECPSEKESASVGAQNIMAARDALKEAGITAAAEDVGGNRGRKIFFYPHSGEILLKRLNRMKIEHFQKEPERRIVLPSEDR